MTPAPPETLTDTQGSTGRARGGVISGYVMRCIREQTGLTQDGLAEQFGVSVDTVAAWETGRRPITAVPVGHMLVYRNRLLQAGASPDLLTALDRAMEADVLLAGVLEGGSAGPHHPLGSTVLQRNVVEMLTWPLTGRAPATIDALPTPRRRGPVATSPELPATSRRAFFTSVRHTAETATRPADILTRRQALYLVSYDPAPDTTPWIQHQQRGRRSQGWLADWLDARSVASVAVRQGDRERMTHFIERTLVDSDPGETANLNYWAYWVGELPRLHGDDAFMAAPVTPGAWGGQRLLAHLVDHLTPGLGFSELYIHTLWSLLAIRPHLLQAAGVDTDVLRERVDVLLDGGTLSAQARRELDGVRYAIRLSRT
ncbi:transcriptional regulator [Embleya scabrispora]|uniref:Transcriptional regulator n=1 Tax=Embleya scabrispora TaxID=159449 RepID=A0A1T3P1N0_9ACTN|nr:helix-turn-helix domain-containing protein [Embleya scabrispora]OPC82988.1 transcriptional regulator [Embleya scabrispora]